MQSKHIYSSILNLQDKSILEQISAYFFEEKSLIEFLKKEKKFHNYSKLFNKKSKQI